jgi:hypothetical protein
VLCGALGCLAVSAQHGKLTELSDLGLRHQKLETTPTCMLLMTKQFAKDATVYSFTQET